jgi:hypothetical protein
MCVDGSVDKGEQIMTSNKKKLAVYSGHRFSPEFSRLGGTGLPGCIVLTWFQPM